MQRRSPKPRRQTQEERASSTGEDRWVTRSSWAVPREILWLNHSYWPPSQGWSTQQGRASSGKQKPLLCCQPETFLIALLVLSSSSIQLYISPSQRNVTLVQKLSKDNKNILSPVSTKITLKIKCNKYAYSNLGIMEPSQELEFPSALMKDMFFTVWAGHVVSEHHINYNIHQQRSKKPKV